VYPWELSELGYPLLLYKPPELPSSHHHPFPFHYKEEQRMSHMVISGITMNKEDGVVDDVVVGYTVVLERTMAGTLHR
jgi:hypothetical protein